jgi:uncharacterized protein YegP (UPF0339 family)
MSGNSIRNNSPVENSVSGTDWQRVRSLTDDQIDAAIANDPDTYAVSGARLGHLAGRYHYVIFRGDAGDWRWRLVAKDGEILAEAATGLATRKQAQAAIAGLRSALLGGSLAA